MYTEEAFERLLLDYDRVFSAMGIPACLWRRTGEIYKANKAFADLVGVDVTKMRDVRGLCIPGHPFDVLISGPTLYLRAHVGKFCCKLLGGEKVSTILATLRRADPTP